MEVREATGYDIAKLLLLNAPKNVLQELELSNDNIEERAEFFDECKSGERGSIGEYSFIGFQAMALFYFGDKHLIFNDESVKIVNSIHIDARVLHRMLDIAKCEEFASVDKLKDEIAKDKASKRGRKSVEVRHNKPGGSKERQAKIRAIWATGEHDSRDNCAEKEYIGLGYGSFKAARKALIGTPEPNRNLPSTP